MLWPCTFQMGLIIYVSLLLLSPKILSLPFDPQDNAFLSRAHSYAHSTICLSPGSMECSPLHQWKTSCGTHLHFRESTFSKFVTTFDNNNHMWCLLLIWWHLTILQGSGATPCTFSSVQSLSRVWLFATPRTAAHQASLSITNSRSLLRLMSIESVMPSNHLIFCCPLLLLPSIFPYLNSVP